MPFYRAFGDGDRKITERERGEGRVRERGEELRERWIEREQKGTVVCTHFLILPLDPEPEPEPPAADSCWR